MTSSPPGATRTAGRRRRILHVIDPAPYGGAESVVSALARGFAARGHDVHLVAFGRGERPIDFLRNARSPSLERSELRAGRGRYLSEVRQLEAIIRRWRPEIVHTHVYHADLVGYLAARRAGAPVLATAHGLTGGDLKNRFYQWLDLRVLARMDAVTCVSPLLVDRVREAGADPERIFLIPNAHDGSVPATRAEARRAVGIPGDGDLVVGWIGRLSFEKGADRFVRAIAALGGRARGIIVGDGPERPALERLIADSGARVTLTGSIPDAGRLVTAFDVLAITSRTEGLPMTALFAMAAGVPIVATAVGALPETLGDSAGWVVDPASEDAIVTGLSAALSDREEARRRAARARARVDERYSLDGWLEAMERAYDVARARRS